MVSKHEPLPLEDRQGAKSSFAAIRNGVPKYKILGSTFVYFMKNHLPSSAAAISYFVLLALFPIMLLLINLGDHFPRFWQIKNYALETLIVMVPRGAQETFVQYLQGVAHPSKGEILTCVIIILWAASWAFTIIEQAISRIWRTSCRSFLHGRLVSLMMMIGVGGLLILSAVATAALASIRVATGARSAHSALVLSGAAWQILFGIIGIMLTISLFALVYRVMPNTRLTIKETLPGAILAGMSWEIAKYIFAWFLAAIPYEGLYGSLATLVAALTWIYISNLIMLFGAQMTALLHSEQLMGQQRERIAVPSQSRAMSAGSSA